MKTPDTASKSKNGTITSADNISYRFLSAIKPLAFEKLNQNVDTDILVIGGGILQWNTDEKYSIVLCFTNEGKIINGLVISDFKK